MCPYLWGLLGELAQALCRKPLLAFDTVAPCPIYSALKSKTRFLLNGNANAINYERNDTYRSLTCFNSTDMSRMCAWRTRGGDYIVGQTSTSVCLRVKWATCRSIPQPAENTCSTTKTKNNKKSSATLQTLIPVYGITVLFSTHLISPWSIPSARVKRLAGQKRGSGTPCTVFQVMEMNQ